MSEHSAGPWKLKFKKNCDWSIYARDGYSIAAISYDTDYGRPKEDAANARIMTAAPDLVEALELLMESVAKTPNGRNWDTYHIAKHTLKKAKG